MNSRTISLLTALVLLLVAAPAASAYTIHVVTPGETLTSVAAQDGLTVGQLAAANGVSTQAELIVGEEIQIPPQGYADAAAPTTEASAPTDVSSTDTGDSGGYVVQPGDTLTAIAQRDGTSVAELAALNGLNPNGILYAGATIELPVAGATTEYTSASPSDSAAGRPVGSAAEGTYGGPPYPTDQQVSGSQIADIADANGVPPSLAEAIGWQESGWNNDEVSVDDAVGVMQILPGTWDWINRTLTAGQPLAPASANDNVRGGVLLLHALLNSTGGSPEEAAAGYYQGLSSVQQNGMYPDTQQYVNDVMSLASQFGGG
jgi:N-acetylmuramoyl-L-alanine amidase